MRLCGVYLVEETVKSFPVYFVVNVLFHEDFFTSALKICKTFKF